MKRAFRFVARRDGKHHCMMSVSLHSQFSDTPQLVSPEFLVEIKVIAAAKEDSAATCANALGILVLIFEPTGR